MKAVVYYNYGSPDVLKCEEIEKPTAGDDEVLIKVRAASINPWDWHYMRGAPYIVRTQAGLRKPKNTRLGVDLAGQVEVVGRNVTQFQPGDEVFGAKHGAFAEYVCANENALVLKPANLTFEQAAAVPIAALTALQGIRDKGRIQPGQKVLINGAAGGVGTYAVQIAKSFGADVTGVCSTRNVDMIRSIGADQVIDYTQENFTQSGRCYDLVFDSVGNHSLSACRRVLDPKGTYVVVGGPDGRWIGALARVLKALLLSRFVSQNLVTFLASTNKEDLVVLKELIEAKKVTPVIDRCYTLSEVPEAIRYLEEGHARGKVVVTLPALKYGASRFTGGTCSRSGSRLHAGRARPVHTQRFSFFRPGFAAVSFCFAEQQNAGKMHLAIPTTFYVAQGCGNNPIRCQRSVIIIPWKEEKVHAD